MEDYVYVDDFQKGTPDKTVDAVIKVNRTGNILPDEYKYARTAVERFFLRTVLPLFDTTQFSWTFGLRSEGSSSIVAVDAKWPDTQYLYDYRQVANVVTNALQTLCASKGIEDIPTFHFNPTTGTFALISTEAFRAGYEVFVSDDFQRTMSTFQYSDDGKEGGLWRLDLTQDVEEAPIQTLEHLSPVNFILVRTNFPVQGTLLPNPVSVDSVSNQDESYLVNMKFIQNNNQSIVDIPFSVGDGATHRWVNVIGGGNARKFEYSFFWKDYADVVRTIVIPPWGRADILAQFRSIA